MVSVELKMFQSVKNKIIYIFVYSGNNLSLFLYFMSFFNKNSIVRIKISIFQYVFIYF